MSRFKAPFTDNIPLLKASVIKQISGKIKQPENFVKALLFGEEDIQSNHINQSTNFNFLDFIPNLNNQIIGTNLILLAMISKLRLYFTDLYKWNNLPKKLKPEILERKLFNHGEVCLYEIGNKIFVFPFTIEKWDVDWEPKEVRLIIPNDSNPSPLITEPQIIRNNSDRLPTLIPVWSQLIFIANQWNELNITSILTRERLAVGDGSIESQKLVNNLIRAILNGDPVINYSGSNKAKAMQGLKGMSNDSTGELIKFTPRESNIIDTITFSWNNTQMFLGIKHNEQKDKKERLVSTEIDVQNDFLDHIKHNPIETRKQDIERNEKLKDSTIEERVLNKENSIKHNQDDNKQVNNAI